MATNMVVKRTFLEFADEKSCDEAVDYVTRGRGRAHSESHLDMVRKMMDFEAEEDDCRPWPILENSPRDGDAETNEEGPSMAAYDTDTTHASDWRPCSELSGHSDTETAKESQPTCGTEDVCGRSNSWSRHSSVPPEEENSEKSLATLLAENMRLASENQLLRENSRLIHENALLRTNPCTTMHADPTPQQVEQLIMSAGPMPTTYFEENRQMPVQPMQYGGYTYAAAPQMMMYGAHTPHFEGNPRRRRGQQSLGLVAGAACAEAPLGPAADNRTTVMLRNLPNNYTRSMVLNLLDTEGFKGKYDFFYLPIDFKTNACLGYAFVNLKSPSLVDTFWRTFDGFSRWVLPSRKVCGVTWSSPHQGLEAHVDRYRNSPVMHASVPEEYRPLVFVGGQCVPFPAPTREPKAPRTRNFVEEK